MQVHCIAVLNYLLSLWHSMGAVQIPSRELWYQVQQSRRDDLIGQTKGVPTQVGFPMQCLPVLFVNRVS